MNHLYKVIFSLIILSFSQDVYSQFNPPIFENISIKDGLPDQNVTYILQDYLGYLWLGTQNGLAKYDGNSVKVFQLEENIFNKISENGIVTVYEDKNKILWAGTLNSGLYRFNRENETFKNFRYNTADLNSINSDQILCLYEDKKGRFWVGTTKGLNLFDRDNEVFTRYYFREGNIKSQSLSTSNQNDLCINAIIEDPSSGDLLLGTERDGLWSFNVNEKNFSKYKFNSDKDYDKKIGWIQSFYKTRDGKIWMASNNTLSSLDPQKKTFKSYIEFPITANQRFSKPGFVYGSVIEDKDGLIWSGFTSNGQGIFCLNPATGSLLQYSLLPEKLNNPNYNNIFYICEDHSGIIWIGTWKSGLMKLDKRRNQFQVLKSDPKNFSNCLSHSDVYSVIYDSKGFIWYCTPRALDKYEIKTNTYKHYLNNETCITQNNYSAVQDKSGYIWLGTSNCGLIRFDPSNNSYRFYYNNPNDSINLVNKYTTLLFLDHQGILWIGTIGFGLYKYDITNNKLTQFKIDPNDPTSMNHDQVLAIFEDRLGTLWVGTNLEGLYKFDRATNKFLYGGFVSATSITEDKQGNFWVADYYTGLNLYDRQKGMVTATYGMGEGLAYKVILGVLEDDRNNLWLSTQNGLSKFDTKSRTFRNYYIEDGLPDNWFNIESIYSKSPEGKMYFGTRGGLMAFYPDSIKDDPVSPQVVLSGISLFNRPGEKLNYKGFISDLAEITLPYDQNDLRFDFVGLHYSSPARNRYKYILENFDNNWVNAGTQRNATYTNLDPGEYVFKVTASNKDGIWNETGTSIKIIILPPWWKTTWAYIIYLFISGSLLYFTWKLQVKRIKAKHEYEMSRFESQKLHEVDEIKTRFFTNISHEFRTPLTLIMGPAKQILSKASDQQIKDDAKVIFRSADKINRLVNELLELSKIEAGKLKLHTQPENLVILIRELVLSFQSFAERKKINLTFNSSENVIIAYVDKDKMEKILSNLISNALKFTPYGGKVIVQIQKVDGEANIIVSDTGVGIAKSNRDKIFDKFYQVEGTHTRDQEGTGIGLALTRELIELHKTKIELESEEGRGSSFKVIIPLGKDHLKPDEILTDDLPVESADRDFKRDDAELFHERDNYKNKVDIESIIDDSRPILLIVEDNQDVRQFIKNILCREYSIFEAENGEDGLEKAVKIIPDIIISDIMMPKMDGNQMSRQLKNDERTSHIPIIMLTAKATVEDKIEGMETGIDEYLFKPFEARELRARIKNLLDQRKRLHEHFRKYGLFDTENRNITPIDKEFLQRFVGLINENLSNDELNIDFIVRKMFVSRSVLKKKISILTGDSPAELIKRIRLSAAAKLIEQSAGNISEIALEVGFTNPAYFSECFRKQFGILPSQYHQAKHKLT